MKTRVFANRSRALNDVNGAIRNLALIHVPLSVRHRAAQLAVEYVEQWAEESEANG